MAVTSYYRDQEYPDFWWVYTHEPWTLGRAKSWWRANRVSASQFLAIDYHPGPLDVERTAMPVWAQESRTQNWLAYMQTYSNAKKEKPPKIKFNPALPILQRLSGMDEKAIREIVTLEI